MSKKIWVEIETTKNISASTHTFKGLIAKDDFDAIINETYHKKWVKLEAVFWNDQEYVYENELFVFTRVLGNDIGKYQDYTGEFFIQAHTIVIIYLLKDFIDPNDRRVSLPPEGLSWQP